MRRWIYKNRYIVHKILFMVNFNIIKNGYLKKDEAKPITRILALTSALFWMGQIIVYLK